MLILHCEDSLEGIFTAIYDAFVYKKQMESDHTGMISRLQWGRAV